MLLGAIRRRQLHDRAAPKADVLHVQPGSAVRPAHDPWYPRLLPADRVRREGVARGDRVARYDRLPAADRRLDPAHVRGDPADRYARPWGGGQGVGSGGWGEKVLIGVTGLLAMTVYQLLIAD